AATWWRGSRILTATSFRSRSSFGDALGSGHVGATGLREPPAHVLAGRRLAGVVVEPDVEAVGALTVGHAAGDGWELVLGIGKRRVVLRGLAVEHPIDDRLEAARLLGARPLVALQELGQHLAPEALEALHDVLVTVLARLRRQDDLVDSVFLVAAQIVAHLPGRPHRPAQAPAVPL